jgi:hypothetical protein
MTHDLLLPTPAIYFCSLEDLMQNLPAVFIALLLAIASHGTVYAADSDETAYEIQEEHAAPVTITDLPGSDRVAPGVENVPGVGNARELKGAKLDLSETAAEATSIDDQQQASEADRRQRMIERCEQNNGIDCAREVDVELGAEAIQQDGVFHVMRRPHAMR